MECSLVKIVLDEIAAAPATADLSELDAATAWVRARIVMRGNDKGPVREIRPAGFEEAVREMKELRWLLGLP